jgi:hypothetical protein
MAGGFDERLCGYEDDDLFLRLFCAGYDNVYIDEPLSKWRIYPTSASFSSRMAQSRMIYANLLFDRFPDQPSQIRYLSRDCIAPRFVYQTMVSCGLALAWRNKEMFCTAIAHLRMLLPHLSRKRRLAFSVALMLFGQFNLALAAYQARSLTNSIAKLLLGLKTSAAPIR